MYIIEYFDEEYFIPDWAEYISTDNNGRIYIWGNEPVYDGIEWLSIDGGPIEHIGDRPPATFSDSCREIKDLILFHAENMENL